MSQPDLDIFDGTEGFGVIYNEENEIVRKVAEVNLPGSSTEGKLSYGVFGATRIIILQGASDGVGFSGADQEGKLYNFVEVIEDWVNMNIPTGQTYTDMLGFTYNVKPINFTRKMTNTVPNRVIYSLLMKETA